MTGLKETFLFFQGRMGRKSFTKRYLLLAVISHLLWLMMLFLETAGWKFMIYLYPLLCLFYLPQASLVIRRANDMDLKRGVVLALLAVLFVPSVLFEFWTTAPRSLTILNVLVSTVLVVFFCVKKGVLYETLKGLPEEA
ncbi:MAG: DUF805 domain-containing protein [Selenomonadales bacterium]|nr:DUF805 domain-containing protein [Selenomonadales bacterium]